MEDFRAGAPVPRVGRVRPRIEWTSQLERDGACSLEHHGKGNQNIRRQMDATSREDSHKVYVTDAQERRYGKDPAP